MEKLNNSRKIERRFACLMEMARFLRLSLFRVVILLNKIRKKLIICVNLLETAIFRIKSMFDFITLKQIKFYEKNIFINWFIHSI